VNFKALKHIEELEREFEAKKENDEDRGAKMNNYYYKPGKLDYIISNEVNEEIKANETFYKDDDLKANGHIHCSKTLIQRNQ
jgi:uncharacterized protein with GYD domain